MSFLTKQVEKLSAFIIERRKVQEFYFFWKTIIEKDWVKVCFIKKDKQGKRDNQNWVFL